MKTETVVSPGNLKLGRHTPNVSLLPIVTCAKGVPCGKKCYCNKACRLYNTALRKWFNSTCLWQSNPVEFEKQIFVYLEKRPATFFRWAVAGDIPDRNYLRMMERVARRFPDTKFLAFTKQYSLLGDPETLPPNLVIVVSGWPGYRASLFEEIRRNYPVAWTHLKGQTSMAGAFQCPGKCEACRYCWGMKAGNTIEFKEH